MKKLIYLCVILFIASSCKDVNKGGEGPRQANGNVFYGGVFKMNETEDFRNLFPHSVGDVVSHRVANQVYEGLVKLSQSDLSVVPALAEKWDKNEDATVWTFYLRKGVKFHDDPCFPDGNGREVTANDFKYCFTRLCTSSPDNAGFNLSFKNRVLGADEYFESTTNKTPLAEGVKGIKVIDDYTFQITLVSPFAVFLNILSTPPCWVYPKEAYEKYGVDMRVKCVGTGPFKVKTVKEGESVILERNENYWAMDEHGNQLPYLDVLKFSFVKEKKSEFLEFKRGNLDMVYRLPVEMIPEIVDEMGAAKRSNSNFNMQVVPAMSTLYLGFQHQYEPFNNKAVRKAFNAAIDREKIVIYTLQGEGIPATGGVVPPSFKAYDITSLKGFTFDPDMAKKYMAEAGYPNGRGFPKVVLQINAGGGDRNVRIAEVVQKMLKENINVDVDINVMPFPEHLESVEMGKAAFWRGAWISDYPDPESFLSLFYGPLVPPSIEQRSTPNTFRYKNPSFDSLFRAAMKETDIVKRFALYQQADQVVIDDAAFMPIFYDENYRLIQNRVKNFDANPMEYRDFTKVYFTPSEKKK